MVCGELMKHGESVLDEMSEQEDLEFVEALRVVDWWRHEHAYPMQMLAANLRYYVKPYEGAAGHKPVTQRLKKLSTIGDKLNRIPGMELSRMADIGGVRAVLPDQNAVDDVLRRVRKNWRGIERVRDYVNEPKISGYRAKHIIVKKNNRLVEIQLRTSLQDVWANQVEADSRWAADFKSGQGHQAVHDYYVSVSKLLACRERGEEPSDKFMQELVRRHQSAKPYLPSRPE